MSASDVARRQLTQALREWIKAGAYSQRRAALELGIAQPNLSGYLSGERGVSIGLLLDAWERVGGQWSLYLGRGEED